ncbi:alpha/beta fold hydrolase [Burkholderia sp. JSH-S8]|nr:alpha/beta fold hydrolase [Burkholderia sp. JSH-S8]
MDENFKSWFDRLRGETLGEGDGIALLASLRAALHGEAARDGAPAIDAASLPRLATPHWQERPYGAEQPTHFDTVLVVGADAVTLAWRDGLAAAFGAARIVTHELGVPLPPVLEALDPGASVAVLLVDDLAPASSAAEAPAAYLGRVLSAFALLRELLGRPLARCHLLHLAPLGHALPLAAAWHGLVKSVALESPRFASGGLWLSDADLARAAPALAARELGELVPGRHRDIGWLDARRCERVLTAKTDLDGAVDGVLRRDETVLVTGGAGALGRAIAEALVRRFGVRVVLCGRRAEQALDVAQRDWLARHPAVRYVGADVADSQQLDALLAPFGSKAPLAAIVHAAGSIDDAPLRAKPLEAIRAVLSPKVLGTLLLDRHAGRLGVRHFVCFSSIASLAGSAGQADYASGNGFMDEYCRIRQSADARGCRYLSINWPYWRDGGMRADPRRLERLSAGSGLVPLAMEEGVDSLLALLARPAPQVAVLPGERSRIDRSFLATPAPRAPHDDGDVAPAGDPMLELRELVAGTLKMEAQAIDADTPFSEYGFDSILLTELAVTIGHRYSGLALEAGVFLDHPTLRELAAWLRGRQGEAERGTATPGEAARQGPAPRPVAPQPGAADVQAELRELVAGTLKMEAQAIDADTPFSEYGFDSILLTELAATIGRRYPGLALEMGVFLDHPTLRELAAWLHARLPAADARAASAANAVDAAASVAAVPPGHTARQADATLLDSLRALASSILKLPVDEIGAHTLWSEFGFDSINLNEFAALIARELSTGPLAADLFLSCATLDELAAQLATRPAPAPAPVAPVTGPDAAARAARQASMQVRSNAAPAAPHRPMASTVSAAPPSPAAAAAAQVPPAAAPASHDEPAEEIAIIGMAGRFPGAEDLAGFWRNLAAGHNAVTPIPADRWRWQDYATETPGEPGKTDCHHAAFLTAIDRFDAAHFSISPREAELMDPQHRLLLECTWEAFENAAIAPGSLQGRRVGLFFGAEKHDYLSLIADSDVDIDPYINTGNAHAMLANRVSYFFGLTGPSITLNTACSSSMTAIRAAVASLRGGESEMALAGGVNILLSPGLFVLNRKMGMLTASDHIKSFDREASGHLFGEGLGLVLLKPLRQALRDGDPVHGVIRAVDVMHGGHGRFLTAPNAPSHEALIRGVLAQAGAAPDDVDYLEAQGSGDQLTDRMELETYHALFGARAGREPLPIGSVKGQIGHLGAASGVTALIKVLLCLSHDRLLPVLHHRHLNWQHDEPFAARVLTEPSAWPPKQLDGQRVPRLAAVHNFGYGGVNGHLLVREALPSPAAAARWPAIARLWVVSARTAAQLRRSVERLLAWLHEGGHRLHGQREPGVESIAWSLQTGRQPLNHRLALLVDEAGTAEALRATGTRLEAWLADGRTDARLLTGVVTPAGMAAGALPPGAADADDAAAIAARWVAGGRIDWAACYGEARPPRLSLPTYPFAATRHWVTPRGEGAAPAAAGTPALPVAGRPAAALHPLLHQPDGGGPALRFTSRFGGDEPFFRDHRIQGVATLPGAAYCEMFLAAAMLATPECERRGIAYRLDQLIWTRPLTAADGAAGIAVTLEPFALPGGVGVRDAFRFTVGSARDAQAQPHAQAVAVPEPVDVSPLPVVVLEHLPVRLHGARLDGAQLYRRFAELGFDYGPSHRCIETLYHHGDEVLARLRAVESGAAGVAGFMLVPGLLDSALQASIGFSLDGVADAGGEGGPLLPFALERLRCHRGTDLSDHVRWVRLRRRASAAGSGVVKLDVELLDADGRTCASLSGYSARRMRFAAGSGVHAGANDAAVRSVRHRFAPSDRYLRHHRIEGQALLPAVALLDLAWRAASDLPHAPDAVLRIARAAWQRPMFVGAAGCEANLRLVERGPGWAVTLEDCEPAGEGAAARAHAQCELDWRAIELEDHWPDLERGAGTVDSLAALTPRFAASLVDAAGHQGGHATVPMLPNGVRIVAGEIDHDTARLTLAAAEAAAGLDDVEAARARSFDLLFAVIDLCGRDGAASGLAVPVGIDECRLHRFFPREIRVALHALPEDAGARTRAYEIRIADGAGRPLAQVARLVMMPLRPDTGDMPRPAALAGEVPAELLLQQQLRELVGALQKIAPDEIGLDDALAQFGLDSFSFTELSNRLNRRFAIDTMPTLFFEHNTIRALAAALLRDWPELAAAPGATLPLPPASPAPLPACAGAAEIAIVGMAIRVPGAASLDAFRACLVAPGAVSAEADAREEDRAVQSADDAAAGPGWFDTGRDDAPSWRPLTATLETAWHLFEEAGIAPATLHGSDTAVYLGVGATSSAVPAASAAHDLPNRLSYEFDFRGPSQAIDTGDSSSLVALARAVDHLRLGRGALVVAGGVDLPLPDGTCGPDGAIGMVLLKRLDDALRDGNRIHAVLAAVAENHGGRTLTPNGPNVDALRELLIEAYRQAGLEVADLGHVEAHGAGTALADAVEREALAEVFARRREPAGATGPRCLLGSLGTRFGRLGAARGVAAVIKTALMLRSATIASQARPADAHDGAALADSGLAPASEAAQPWPAPPEGRLRCAGVSSLGAGGANAHAVLREHRASPSRRRGTSASAVPSRLFLLSAHSEAALRAQARALADHLAQRPEQGWVGEAGALELNDIAHTLQTGRDALAWRFGVVAADARVLQRQLRMFGDGASAAPIALADYRVAHVTELRHDLDGDEDLAMLARQWLDKGKLGHVLGLWLDGMAIDWRAAWPGRAAADADLPPYPFGVTGTPSTAACSDAPVSLDTRVRQLLIEGLEAGEAACDTPSAELVTLMQRVRDAGELLGTTLSVGDAYRHRDIGALRARLHRRAAASAATDALDDPFARYYRMAFGELDGFGRELLELADGVVLDVLHNVAPGKPALMLLSPMACLGTAWLHQVRAFAADYSVIVCHYPGHAASTGAERLRGAGEGLGGLARLLWAALDRLGVEVPVHLVGWSLGGLVAQCMAGADPRRVASMTLVNALDEPGRDGIDRAMRELVHEIATQVVPEVARHFDGDTRAIKACHFASILDDYLGLAMDAAARARLAEPAFPVLVLAGGRDRVIAPEAARRLHARIGEAAFDLLEHAGHYLPMTHAGWFNERLRQHLEVTI